MSEFSDKVYELVAQIPVGKLMTYGDLAGISGHPYAARQVGGLAHFGPTELPWHRVVNREGGLASGYYGGKAGHKLALEAEGVPISDNFTVVDFQERRWRPSS